MFRMPQAFGGRRVRLKTGIFFFVLMMALFSCAHKGDIRSLKNASGQIDVRLGGIESIRFCKQSSMIYYTVVENNNRQIARYHVESGMRDYLFNTSYEERLEDISSQGEILLTTDQYDVQGDILLAGPKGNIINLGRPFVSETIPRFSPDGSCIAFRALEAGKSYLVIIKKTGEELYRSEFKALDDLAFGHEGVYLLRGNEIVVLDYQADSIRVLSSSPVRKTSLFYDISSRTLYSLSNPLERDKETARKATETVFITRFSQGQEHYLFGGSHIHCFSLSDDILFYTRGPRLSYRRRDELVYEFSSVYHYNNYMERTDDPGDILPLAEAVVSRFPAEESLLFLTRYLNTLLEQGRPRLAEMESEKWSFLLRQEGKSKSDLLSLEPRSASPAFQKGLFERELSRLYEMNDYIGYLSFFNKHEKQVSGNRKNKWTLYAAQSELSLGRRQSALLRLEELISRVLYSDPWSLKALTLYLKEKGDFRPQSGYSLNQLNRIREREPSDSFLYYGATAAVMETLLIVKNYSGALQEWEKHKNRGHEEHVELLYPPLLHIYPHYASEEGIAFFSKLLEEGYSGIYYEAIVSFLQNTAMNIVDRYENEGDLLKARKILLMLRDALPGNIDINRSLIRIDYLLGHIMDTAGRYKALYLESPEDPLLSYLYGFALTYVGTSYEVKKRPDFTISAYDEALELVLNAVERQPQEPVMHLTLGWLYEEMERLGEGQFLEQSLEEYRTGLALTEKSDTRLQGYFEKNIGNIYFKLKIYDRALTFYRLMEEKIPAYQSREEEKLYNLRLSTIYYNLNDYGKAMESDTLLLKMYLEDQDIQGQDYILKHMGMLASLSGRYLEAVRFFERALNLGLFDDLHPQRVLYHRNIAYNALLGDDSDKALAQAKKGLDILQKASGTTKKGQRLLDISIAMSLSGAEEAGAYKGFTPDMERNLLLSIMAASSMEKGEMGRAVQLFEEKLSVSDSPYADMIITNNFASLYYRIGNDIRMEEYLNRSLNIAQSNNYLKGVLVNRLSSIFLKMDASPHWYEQLEKMEDDIRSIRDKGLHELHQRLMIIAFMKSAPNNPVLSSLEESVSYQMDLFRRYDKISRLFQSQNLSPPMKRLYHLFTARFLGEDARTALNELTGEDDFLDFLIFLDCALLSRGNPALAFDYLEKASAAIHLITEKSAPFFAAFMKDHGDLPYRILEDVYRSDLSYDRVIAVLASFESFYERIQYLFFSPELASQMDIAHLGNYFYFLSKKNSEEIAAYDALLGDDAKLIAGIPFMDGPRLRSLLTTGDMISYRLHKKYLLISEKSMTLSAAPESPVFTVDREGKAFKSQSFNAWSLAQLSLFYEGRLMPLPWEDAAEERITSENSGYFRLSSPVIKGGVNPYEIRLGDLSTLDFLSEGLTIDGLWIETDEDQLPVAFRLLTDIALYTGLNHIKINDISLSYRQMDDYEFAHFINDKTKEIDRKAYLYFREKHYGRAFRELSHLVPLLRIKGDKALLTNRLYLMITIASDHLRNPDLIKNELREYVALKGLDDTVYYKNLAALYERTGFYGQAADIYEQGLIPGDVTLQLASLYEKNGHYTKAISLLESVNTDISLIRQATIYYKYFNENERAIDLLDKVTQKGLDDYVSLLKGSVDIRRGLYEAAMSTLKPLTESQNTPIRLSASIGVANLLFKTNRFVECLNYIRTALKMIPEKEHIAEQVILRNLQALTLAETGSEDLALSEIDTALALAEQYNILSEISAIKINKALILRETGSIGEAAQLLEKELSIAESQNNDYILKGLYRHLAMTYYELDDKNRSLLYLGKMRNRGNLTPEEQMYDYFYTGLLMQNTALLEKAVGEAEKIKDQSTALEITYQLGLLSKKTGHLEHAAALLDTMAREMNSPGLQIKVLKKYQDIYRTLAISYFDSGQFPESLFTVEKLKRIAFLVNNPLGAGPAIIPADKRAALNALKNDLYNLDLLMRRDHSVASAYEAKKEALDRLKLEIAVQQKGTADIPALLDPTAFLSQRLSSKTAFLSYLVLEERTLLLSFHKGTITGYSLPAGKEELTERIAYLRDLITETASEAAIEKEADALGTLLIPLRLTDERFLVVSPSGVLNYLPFSLLRKQDSYLIDRFPVTSIPDMFLLKKTETEEGLRSILAVGNPDLNDPGLELYFAQKEAGEIKFIFHEQTDVLKGKAATEGAIRKKMQEKTYDIVHFACHGYFNRQYALLSHLLFAPSEGEDGRFDIEEIRTDVPDIRLAVLSACDSGVGVLGEGEEITALDRAFMKSEDTAVISSLWRISDVATGMLFKQFYRYLRQGIPASKALWKAKQELRLYFSHPSYWSSMKYTGN